MTLLDSEKIRRVGGKELNLSPPRFEVFYGGGGEIIVRVERGKCIDEPLDDLGTAVAVDSLVD
jgi:hypothetical protein